MKSKSLNMTMLSEVETNVDALLVKYEAALGRGNSPEALKVALEIETELNRLPKNEIRVVTETKEITESTIN